MKIDQVPCVWMFKVYVILVSKWMLCFWVGSRSEETPCYRVHRISCQSPFLQASAESTSSYLPMFIYHFSNTLPLHLIHSSMLDISKQFWIIDKANKWGTVRVWIYLFIIRKAHGHACVLVPCWWLQARHAKSNACTDCFLKV